MRKKSIEITAPPSIEIRKYHSITKTRSCNCSLISNDTILMKVTFNILLLCIQ